MLYEIHVCHRYIILSLLSYDTHLIYWLLQPFKSHQKSRNFSNSSYDKGIVTLGGGDSRTVSC